MTTLTRLDDMAYYQERLRFKWRDGDSAFCKRCDRDAPLVAVPAQTGFMLCCPTGHLTHPISVIVSRGIE